MKRSITIEEYLISKGIKLGKKRNSNLNDLSVDKIREQIGLINKVHELIKGGSSEPYLRLINTVGKDEEEFKVLLRRFCKITKLFKSYEKKNEFEDNMLILSDKIINQSEKALEQIYNEGYEDIIRRSMKNKEVIVYYPDNNCLYNEENIIMYKDKGISYNFNELDIARYIFKIKKNLNEECLNLIIDEYINVSKKKEWSKKYIEGYLSFPQEVLKLCVKYCEKPHEEETILKYLEKLMESNLCEGLE